MSELKKQLMDDMKVAMREKNTLQLETIRMVRAAIQRREVDERIELGDDDVLSVLTKMVKQCNDAASQFDDAGRDDLASKERANIAIMETYLPARLSDDEVERIIREAIERTGASSMKDMGRVMGAVRPELQGRADMGEVSKSIRSLLDA